MKNRRGVFVILLALLVAIPVGWASEVQAQTKPGAAQGAAGTMEVEGKIKSVDPSGRMVTLEDGTQLTIPPTVKVQPGALKEGAIVKASFTESAGQKIVTAIQVR